MSIRKTVPLLIVMVFGGISPALADCCSGNVFDCAAAVVTDGLSCEVETIISTIKNLVNLTNNILHDIDGQTQSAEQSARQSVTDAYNSMQSQSQQASADLAQAKTQADLIYHEETAIRSLSTKTVNSAGGLQANSPTTPASSGPNTRFATVDHTQNLQTASQSASAQNNGTPGNTLQRITAAPVTQNTVSIESEKAPHGQYADAFSRGLKLITTLNATGTSDLSQVNQYLANALATEGPGVAAADTLAGAMKSPLNDIESELSSMLTNPLSAFDPSSAVDSVENSITANMSGNISKMIDDITTGPNQAFNAAGPTFDDLLSNAENAQTVAAAMDRLYKERTPGAANALYALLPQEEYAGLTTKATANSHLAANFGPRMSSAKVKANLTTARQKILLSVKPLNVAPLHAAVAQFKAQRAQGKSAQAPSMLATYRATTTRQLDGYFAGKTPSAMATERDQLVAQARTKFASDPKTQNGVIALINSEAQKQGAGMTAAVPGQRIPTMTAGGAANNAAVMTSPATTISPAAAMTSARPPTGLAPAAVPAAFSAKSAIPAPAPVATSAVAPSNGAPSQQKVASWGTTPAWSPPAAASTASTAAGAPAMTTAAPSAPQVVTAVKPATALRTLQPVQKAVQPSSIQPAPSSMTANP